MSATLVPANLLEGAERSRAGRIDDGVLTAVAVADDALLVGRRRGAAGPKWICVPKRRYGRDVAHRVARMLRQRDGEEVHAYACGCCDAWHVGHGIDLDAKDVRHAAVRAARTVVDLRVREVVVVLDAAPERDAW